MMLMQFLLLFIGLVLAAPSPSLNLKWGEYRYSQASGEHVEDEITPHVLNLTRRRGKPVSLGYIKALSVDTRPARRSSPVARYEDIDQHWMTYTASVKIGTQWFELLVDTGSSNTWVVTQGVTCVDINDRTPGNPLRCKSGQLYTQKLILDPTCKTCLMGWANKFPDGHIAIAQVYGDRTFVRGPYIQAPLTLAGLTLKDARVGVAEHLYWHQTGPDGLPQDAGLLGLGGQGNAVFSYPTQNGWKYSTYDPVFIKMWDEKIVSPIFTLALERNTGGYLSLGGIPPVAISTQGIRTPIIYRTVQNPTPSLPPHDSLGHPVYTFYNIQVNGFTIDGKSTKMPIIMFLDSGTTMNYVPTSIAQAINAKFQSSRYVGSGEWQVSCSGKIPSFAVVIGPLAFTIDSRDMVINLGSGYCKSTVKATSDPSAYILGAAFMKNVLAVHDLGRDEMRIYQRKNY